MPLPTTRSVNSSRCQTGLVTLSYHMMVSDVEVEDVEEERRRGKARVGIDAECFAPCVETEAKGR